MKLLQKRVWIGLAGLWAGVSLAGNLVAAPAKFQVDALDLPLALQVGRAQFAWIGYVEWVLLLGIVAGCMINLRRVPNLLIVAVGIFLLQQFWLQPILQERSDMIIAGQSVADSSMHLVFTCAEIGKFLALAAYMALGLKQLTAPDI